MAGPELHKRLQPRLERLSGIECAGLVARVERAALRWLLEERETVPVATEDRLHLPSEPEAEIVADLEAWGLRRAERKLVSGGEQTRQNLVPIAFKVLRQIKTPLILQKFEEFVSMRLGFPNLSFKVDPRHCCPPPVALEANGERRAPLKLSSIQIVSFWSVQKGMRGVGGAVTPSGTAIIAGPEGPR